MAKQEAGENIAALARGRVAAPRSRRANGVPRMRGWPGRRRQLTGILLVSPAVILIGWLFVIPLGLDGWMSLNNWPLLGAHDFAGLSNYRTLFADAGVMHALAFTAVFTAVIVPLVFCAGLVLAALLLHSRPGVAVLRAA